MPKHRQITDIARLIASLLLAYPFVIFMAWMCALFGTLILFLFMIPLSNIAPAFNNYIGLSIILINCTIIPFLFYPTIYLSSKFLTHRGLYKILNPYVSDQEIETGIFIKRKFRAFLFCSTTFLSILALSNPGLIWLYIIVYYAVLLYKDFTLIKGINKDATLLGAAKILKVKLILQLIIVCMWQYCIMPHIDGELLLNSIFTFHKEYSFIFILALVPNLLYF